LGGQGWASPGVRVALALGVWLLGIYGSFVLERAWFGSAWCFAGRAGFRGFLLPRVRWGRVRGVRVALLSLGVLVAGFGAVAIGVLAAELLTGGGGGGSARVAAGTAVALWAALGFGLARVSRRGSS
jgi:hypothetical protein